MQSVKFEPGHEYRTRDGRRARVYATDGIGSNAIHGAVMDGKTWKMLDWYKDGAVTPMRPSVNPEDTQSHLDLMPPEPERRTVWVGIYDRGGELHAAGPCFDDLDGKQANQRMAGSRPIANVKVTFAEGEGLPAGAEAAHPMVAHMAESLRSNKWTAGAEVLNEAEQQCGLMTEAKIAEQDPATADRFPGGIKPKTPHGPVIGPKLAAVLRRMHADWFPAGRFKIDWEDFARRFAGAAGMELGVKEFEITERIPRVDPVKYEIYNLSAGCDVYVKGRKIWPRPDHAALIAEAREWADDLRDGKAHRRTVTLIDDIERMFRRLADALEGK